MPTPASAASAATFDTSTYVGTSSWTDSEGTHHARPTDVAVAGADLRFSIYIQVTSPSVRTAMTFVAGALTADGIVIDLLPKTYVDTPLRANLESSVTPAYLAASLTDPDPDASQGRPTLPAVTVNDLLLRDQLRTAYALTNRTDRALALAMVQAGFNGHGAELEVAVSAATDTTTARAHSRAKA